MDRWESLTKEAQARIRQCVHRALQRIGPGCTAAAVRVQARATHGFDGLTLDATVAALQELRASGAVQMRDEGDSVFWRVTPPPAVSGS